MHGLFHGRFARLVARFAPFLVIVTSVTAQIERRATNPTIGKAAITRTHPHRALVEGLSVPLQDLRVTDLQGRDISDAVAARMENGKVTLDLGQPSAVVLKPKTVQTISVLNTEKIVLPGGAVVPMTASGTSTGTALAKAIWFRLTFTASPVPAPWDEKENSYLTRLTFGLKRPDGAPPTLSLDQPVIIKLGYKGFVAPETAMISLDAPGLENEKTIDLHFTPQSTQPTVLVRSSITDVDLQLSALPRLILFPDRDTIVGLGLDTATVTVTNVQPDGRSTPVTRVTPVNVTIEGGARFEPAAVSLSAEEATTRFSVRSSGLRALTIRANADGITGGTTIRQSFPVGPLLATLIGGALGGFSRRFMKGARRSSNQRRLTEGVVVGLVVFVAGVLGVGYLNLPAAIVSTEAGAFLTGTLGGFAGVSALEILTRRNARSAEA
jgi:hypothetical protein